MAKSKNSLRGAEALFGAAFTYAFSGILVREISSMWGDKAQVAARFSIVLVLLIVYRLWRRKTERVPRAKLPFAIGLGLATAGMVLFFTFSIQKTTVANTLFVFYALNMISSFLLGTVLLKEHVTADKLLAIAFVFAGLMLYSGAIEQGSLGIIFAIIAGLCGGGVNLASRLLEGVDRNAVLIVQYAVVVILTGILLIISGDQILRTPSWHGFILTMVFSLFIILGSYFVLYGFQNFDVNIGTVIMSTEIVFGALMAYVLFHEVPKPHEFVGGLLIFTGSVVGGLELDVESWLKQIKLRS